MWVKSITNFSYVIEISFLPVVLKRFLDLITNIEKLFIVTRDIILNFMG